MYILVLRDGASTFSSELVSEGRGAPQPKMVVYWMCFQHDSRCNNLRDEIFTRYVPMIVFFALVFFWVRRDVSCAPTLRNPTRNVVHLYRRRRLFGG